MNPLNLSDGNNFMAQSWEDECNGAVGFEKACKTTWYTQPVTWTSTVLLATRAKLSLSDGCPLHAGGSQVGHGGATTIDQKQVVENLEPTGSVMS